VLTRDDQFMEKLNLDALETMQHVVEKAGVSYCVRPITPRIASMVDAAIEADPAEKATLYYDAVAKLVPSMPRTEVDDLSAMQVLAIIELAGKQVTIVQKAAADPNAASSTETPATSSALPAAT
jgi:hypothetical protein